MDTQLAQQHPLAGLFEQLYRIQEERYSDLHGAKASESLRRLGKKAYLYDPDDSYDELDLPEQVQSFLNHWIFTFAPRSLSNKVLMKTIYGLVELLHPQLFDKDKDVDEDGSGDTARDVYEMFLREELEDFLKDERDLDRGTQKQSLSKKQRQEWLDLAEITMDITVVKTEEDRKDFLLALLKIFETQKFQDLLLNELPEVRAVLS